MQDWQQRVVAEKAELDEKLDKLAVYSRGQFFLTLPPAEQERMNTQKYLMCALSSVLGARISNFA